MPAPAPARAPAGTSREGAAAVYFPACINRIFGNPRARAHGAVAARGAASPSPRAPACRCGSRRTSPGTAARRRGARRATAEGHELMARGSPRRCCAGRDEGELPLLIDASSCTQALGEELAGALDEELRERLRAVRVLDSIEWVHDRLLGSLQLDAAGSPRWPCTRPARPIQGGLDGEAARDRGGARRGGGRAARPRLLRDGRRPRPAAPRAARRGAGATRRASSPDASSTPACRCNRTCEMALEGVTGRPYESIVATLERLTRGAGGGAAPPAARRDGV